MDRDPHLTDGAADEHEFAEVVAGLGRLADRIDRASHPGRAWTRPPAATRRPWVIRLAAASAAAAALLIAAVTLHRPARPARQADPANAPAQAAASAPAGGQASSASAPLRIDPSVASYVTWRMPRVSMPSTRDANGLTWSVPSFSMPSFVWPAAKPSPATTTQPKAT